ncbi:translation initiation factor IF-3 [Paenibacillus herberti]|uniref:Translation initiation factor IF-3 n=1 Tax=Paenibacillus herberti TaxID=1619309 RepID=A0A229NZ17_9BACL|nr:translation initiation factor IF-3 [Paenibacillus herberti]OXM14899.1 translation initiation factor IF-3 [Paenibacillus herberti]
MLIMNEKIKASEVLLTGLDGEDLGIVSREEALRMAKEHRVSLVCTSLMSSPPPCSLMAKGKGKEASQKEASAARKAGAAAGGFGQAGARSATGSGKGGGDKAKELRFTAHIEEHDYDTKLRQADKHLRSGKPVQIVVKASGAKEGAAAKAVVERLLGDLKEVGVKETGIQSSGKGSQVRVNPK